MKFSWSAINRSLFIVSLFVAGSAWFVPSSIIDAISSWQSDEELGPAVPPTASSPKDKKSLDSNLGKLPIPTVDDIEKASLVSLRRMQPPTPVPPPESPPVAVAPAEAELFTGSLIGVIQDSDPKYCYAVLKWPDNRIQLIAKGGQLIEADDSPRVSEVNAEIVTIEKGERKQTLELRGNR
jgi:hypothetical protein